MQGLRVRVGPGVNRRAICSAREAICGAREAICSATGQFVVLGGNL